MQNSFLPSLATKSPKKKEKKKAWTEVQNFVNVSSFVPRTLEEIQKRMGHFYHLLSGIRQTLPHNAVSSSTRHERDSNSKF